MGAGHRLARSSEVRESPGARDPGSPALVSLPQAGSPFSGELEPFLHFYKRPRLTQKFVEMGSAHPDPVRSNGDRGVAAQLHKLQGLRRACDVNTGCTMNCSSLAAQGTELWSKHLGPSVAVLLFRTDVR